MADTRPPHNYTPTAAYAAKLSFGGDDVSVSLGSTAAVH